MINVVKESDIMSNKDNFNQEDVDKFVQKRMSKFIKERRIKSFLKAKRQSNHMIMWNLFSPYQEQKNDEKYNNKIKDKYKDYEKTHNWLQDKEYQYYMNLPEAELHVSYTPTYEDYIISKKIKQKRAKGKWHPIMHLIKELI